MNGGGGALSLLAGFAALTAAVAAGWTAALDRAVTVAAVTGRTALLSEVAVNVTALGSAPVVTLIAILAIAYCLVVRRPRLVLALAWTPLAFLLNEGMKLAVRNPRPVEAIIGLPPSYGFPSGHSVAASALFLTLALVAAASSPHPGVRRLLVGAGVGIALLVAWSRVYLGVHYFTDVCGGLLLGSAGAIAAAGIATRAKSGTQDQDA